VRGVGLIGPAAYELNENITKAAHNAGEINLLPSILTGSMYEEVDCARER
jgi:hypothetical protein